MTDGDLPLPDLKAGLARRLMPRGRPRGLAASMPVPQRPKPPPRNELRRPPPKR